MIRSTHLTGSLAGGEEKDNPSSSAELEDWSHLREDFVTLSRYTQSWECWVGPDHRFLFVSPGCVALTGRPADAFMQDPQLYQSIVHPLDRHLLESHLKDHSRLPDYCRLEFRILLPSGEERWLRHTCQPLTGEGGRSLGRRISHVDVTRLRRLEGELREAAGHWERTFDALPDLVVLLDAGRRIMRINEGMAKRLGSNPESCEGRLYRDVLAQAKRLGNRWLTSRDMQVARKSPGLLFRDGIRESFLVTNQAVTERSLGGTGCLVIARPVGELLRIAKGLHGGGGARAKKPREGEKQGDTAFELRTEIEARALAQSALNETNRRQRTLFQSAPIGIAITDTRGVILEANPVLGQLLAVKLPEVIGRRLDSFCRRTVDRKRLQSLRKPSDQSFSFEFELVKSDGRPFFAFLRTVPYGIGREQGWLHLLTDVTEQRQAEHLMQGIIMLQELSIMSATREEYLERIVALLQSRMECSGVGVRLQDTSGAWPFVASVGFSRSYLREESSVCGQMADCSCREHAFDPLALDGGGDTVGTWLSSAWTASMPRVSVLGRQVHGRGPLPCLEANYQNLAFCRILNEGRQVGSIQLAHHQDRKFSAQSLLLLESASLLVGKTLHHFDVEEELVRSMARFRSMFERHHSVMLLVDSDSGAILDANQAAERFYGHSRAKLMEMSLGELEVTESGEVGRKGKGVDLKEGKASLVNHCLAGGDVRIVEIHPSRISMDEQSRTFCIIHDVTERHQLQRLVLDVGDQERQRIGRDLHDSLGGSLSGLAMLSKALEQRLLANGAEDAELAGEIASGIKDAIGQTRSIARGLCPVGLSSVGFLQGLQDFAHGVQRRSGVKCSLKVPEEVSLREEFAATHLFHIVAEATNNALRHGRAGEVRIVVAERRSILTVSVEDDGIGISRTSDRSMGMGLRTMQYRADVIGAKLEIVSVEPHGTRISCILPLVLPDSNTAFRRKGN